MSQSSREYVTCLHKFYSVCLQKGVARIKRSDIDLISIDKCTNELPSVFQDPIALPLRISKDTLWVFPGLSNRNKLKLEEIINKWDEYLVGVSVHRKYSVISLIDYRNKVIFKRRIKLYSIKT